MWIKARDKPISNAEKATRNPYHDNVPRTMHIIFIKKNI